jgi:hypothetical protein
LRVSALPELNYTALANGASVYGIAQYHLIIRQRSQDNRDAVQCNKHQRNEVLFTELHSITQYQRFSVPGILKQVSQNAKILLAQLCAK